MAEVETPEGGAAPEKPAVKTVDYDRFKAVTKDRDEWKGKVAEYEAQVQTLTEKAAKVDTLLETIEKLKGEHKSAASAWAEERGLLSAGVTDPEDVELVRFHYGRMQGEAKPKTIGDFVGALKAVAEGKGPEGMAVPRGLSHLFKVAEATAPEVKQEPRTVVAPRASGDGRPPPASPPVTADGIAKATEAWQRNPTAENKKALDDILAAHRAQRSR